MSAPILTDMVRRVATARRTAAELDTALAAAREAFTNAHADLIARSTAARQAVAEAERELRVGAEATYAATGEKRPAPGVEIKVGTRAQYDEVAAFRWAQQTRMALVPEALDRKAFEKIAKATTLPFVEYVDEPKATIATDLDKALAVAEATTAPEVPA